MKLTRNSFLSAALCILMLPACSPVPAGQPPAPESPPPVPPEATQLPLRASDFGALLSGLELSAAQLTLYTDEGGMGTYPADAAICAADYMAYLRDFSWVEYEPYPAEQEEESGYRCQLAAPGVTITSFQSSSALHVVTDVGEAWLTLPEQEGGPYAWMVYDTFDLWYQEAAAADRFGGGEGTPLTSDELKWFRDYTTSVRDCRDEAGEYLYTGSTPISCFFTSKYSDPRDMDAENFLCYCPDQGTLGPEDEAEFQLVQAKLNWRSGSDGHLFTVSELPVPCHRLPRPYIDEILTCYAGITVDDMHTDWREEAFYIPETDCFYSFASDFGPGSFYPLYGERQGDVVTLWEGYDVYEDASDVLTLRADGDSWKILSHQPAGT